MAEQSFGDRGVTIKLSTLLLAGAFFAMGFFVGQKWETGFGGRSAGSNTGSDTDAVVAQPTADDGAPSVNLDSVVPISDTDFIRGNEDAKIVLVEYSDLECPFCARFHPTVQQIVEEYPDDVAWVYRHYPLSFHPNAQKAAEGSECVGKQLGGDGFWKYVDALIDLNNANGGSLTPDNITEGAATAGANAGDFQTCLDSGEMAGVVSTELAEGTTAGVNGTPGTFVVVDGKAVDFIGGALPYESVKATIDSYLN